MHWAVVLAATPPATQAGTPGWSWNVFLGAIAGGLIGAGIPAVMTMVGWRRERARRREDRQWADAEIVADARHLLHDIDPDRRGLNVSTAPGAEDALWASLNQRRDEVRRQLLRMAAGHPSSAVQSAAGKLEVRLFTTAIQAEWLVSDVIKRRETTKQLGYAQETYESAVAACDELESAVKAAAQGK